MKGSNSNTLGNRIRGFSTALLLLAGVALSGRASVRIGPDLEKIGEEQRLRTIQEQAKISLREKVMVGQVRYDAKMAYRYKLVQSMQARVEERRRTIVNPPRIVQIKTRGDLEGQTGLMWSAILLVAGLLGLRHHFHRQASPALRPAVKSVAPRVNFRPFVK